MYFFNRNRAEIPKWFYRKEAYDASLKIAEYLCLDEKERRQTLPPVYKTNDLPGFIIDGLAHATVEKCAFCEQKKPDLTVHLFRPTNLYDTQKSSGHQDYYIWESLNWNNMFPICRACQSGSAQYFPVLGKHKGPSIEEFKNWRNQLLRNMPEKNEVAKNLPFLISYEKDVPKIIEPSDRRDMKRYFQASFNGKLRCHQDTGKGPNTITTFQLNRRTLCQDRANYISARLHQLGDIICNSPSKYERDLGDHFEFSTQEFSTYYYLILRRLGVRLKNITRANGRFDLTSIKAFYSKIIVSRDQFDACLKFLREEDAHYEEVRLQTELGSKEPALPEEKTTKAPKKIPSLHFESYPRLKRVRIKNFKSLESIELTFPKKSPDYKKNEVAPCLLILGENSTGKSSVLEAICYASIGADALKQLNINPKRIVLDPRYMGSEGQKTKNISHVEVEFHPHALDETDFSFKIQLNRDKGTYHQVNSGPNPLIFAYGAHRLFGDEQKHRNPISNVETLFNNNVCTTNPESWLIDLYNSDVDDFNNVIAAIREVIQVDGQFSTIDVVPKGGKQKNQHCEIKLKRDSLAGESIGEGEKKVTSHIVPMRFDVVSSGYRVVLALICDIFNGIMVMTGCKAKDVRNFNAIVMIDEIEAHLHPRWKLQIISGLRTALPNVTFIFTSHDPLCIRGMYQGEVIVLNRFNNREGQYNESFMNEVVEQITEFPNIDTLTVDQLLTSDLFNLYSADSKRMDRYLAHIADIVSKRKEGDVTLILNDGQKQAMSHFQKEIVDALPIGDSELTMLVQEAVAEFLAQRREASGGNLSELRKSAKEKIKSHLKDFIT